MDSPTDLYQRLNFPLILLSTVCADSFIGCFSEVFTLSLKLSKIRCLNLRGISSNIISKQKLIRILSICDQIAHLNLNFMAEQVDEDALFLIGSRF